MRAILLALLLVAGCSGVKMETVILETTHGDIEIELFRDKAPLTVENFVQYVNAGHYDGTIFHRVIDGFMIQGGGFLPDGNQRPTRAPVALEAGLSNTKGTVAMARTSAPNSATCQFFINVADNAFLDPGPQSDGYAVFGRVVSGMDAVDKIKTVNTQSRGGHENWPVEDIIIKKAYMKG